MKYTNRLGKALMFPVACLPVAGLLLGMGYWMQNMMSGNASLVSMMLIRAGATLIDNTSLLFAIGVAIGMADDQEGSAAIASVAGWLVIQSLLSADSVTVLSAGRIDPSPFEHIDNQIVGIACGLLGAECCNRYRKKKLPGMLSLFCGRPVVCMSAIFWAAIGSLALLFIWPYVYGLSVYIGRSLLGTGALGVGIYMLLNRLLIPTGLHHALNTLFWFDTAGISDLYHFWNGTGVYGVTGQYMTGFFPVMIFGLPGAALAMYQTAYPSQRKKAGGLLMAAVICSVLTGITEPLEFAFMFMAPGLFFVHAFLTGLSGVVCALLPLRLGFNFSAGLLDYIMSCSTPMSQNPWLLLPVGLVFGILYYAIFRFCILKYDLKTPGRENADTEQNPAEKIRRKDNV